MNADGAGSDSSPGWASSSPGSAGMAALDVEHLEELFGFTLREMLAGSAADWRVILEHKDANIDFAVESRLVTVDSDPSAPARIFRCAVDVPDLPHAFAVRGIMSRNRAKEFNEFIVSEELVEELRGPDPGDPEDLGRIQVWADRHNYFGWSLQALMLFTTWRLPDGSGLLLKIPVELEQHPGGTGSVWRAAAPAVPLSRAAHMSPPFLRRTMRKYLSKHRSIVAYQVAPAPDGPGIKCTLLDRRRDVMAFLPDALHSQLFARVWAKTSLSAVRVVLSEYAKACTAAGSARSAGPLSFLSGSAGPPLQLRRPGGLRLGPSPFVLHAFSPSRAAEPGPESNVPPGPEANVPAPKANELFYDFEEGLAAEERAAAAGPGALHGTVPEVEGLIAPRVLARSAEAARASLELALRLESMSLADPAPPRRPRPAAEGGEAPPPPPTLPRPVVPPKALARPRPEEAGPGAEFGHSDGGRMLFTCDRVDAILQSEPDLEAEAVAARVAGEWARLSDAERAAWDAAAYSSKRRMSAPSVPVPLPAPGPSGSAPVPSAPGPSAPAPAPLPTAAVPRADAPPALHMARPIAPRGGPEAAVPSKPLDLSGMPSWRKKRVVKKKKNKEAAAPPPQPLRARPLAPAALPSSDPGFRALAPQFTFFSGSPYPPLQPPQPAPPPAEADPTFALVPVTLVYFGTPLQAPQLQPGTPAAAPAPTPAPAAAAAELETPGAPAQAAPAGIGMQMGRGPDSPSSELKLDLGVLDMVDMDGSIASCSRAVDPSTVDP
eukprot:tig00021680_g23040.t1